MSSTGTVGAVITSRIIGDGDLEDYIDISTDAGTASSAIAPITVVIPGEVQITIDTKAGVKSGITNEVDTIDKTATTATIDITEPPAFYRWAVR